MTKWLLLLVLTSGFLNAQSNAVFEKSNQRFMHLDQTNGLSQSTVTAITQDSLGYLWFGTQSGLNRYDGYSFKVMSQSNSQITSNHISALCVLADSQLWVSTRTGLNTYHYKTGQFTNITKDKDARVSSNLANHLVCDNKRQTVFVGTYDNGLYAIDPSYHTITNYPPLRGLRVYSLKLHQRSLYIATNQGLFVLDIDSNRLNKLSSFIASILTIDNNNNLLAGTTDGKVVCFSITEKKLVVLWSTQVSHDQAVINDIISNDNRLWVASTDGLLLLDSEGTLINTYHHNKSDSSSLANNMVRLAFLDKDNNIWLSARNSGLSYFNPLRNQLGHISDTTYPNNPVVSKNTGNFAIDDKGLLWISTASGMQIFKQGKFHNAYELYSGLRPMKNDVVSSLLINSQYAWFATIGRGVVRYSFTTNSLDRFNNDRTQLSRMFNCIAMFKGDVLVSSRGNGILKFSPNQKKFIPYFNDDQPQPQLPYYIFPQADDLWISSLTEGLFHYSDDHVTQLTTTQGLSSNVIYGITKDQGGRLWLATEVGITVINKDLSIEKILTQQNGLANEAIWSVIFDKQQSVWAGSSGGLIQINTDDFSIINYGLVDGIQGPEYTTQSHLLADDGRLFMGGNNGFNQFYPQDLLPITSSLTLTLGQVTVLGEKLTPLATPELIATNVEYISQLTLDHKQDYITFKYSVLDYSSRNINYYYRVLGLSDTWRRIEDNLRQFSLNNVPPGQYTIEVVAKDVHDHESKPHRLSLTIEPPWWWSDSLKLFYLVLVVLLLCSYLYGKKRAVHLLEATVRQRTGQLSHKNSQLEATLVKLQHAQAHLIESEKMAALGGLVAGVAHEINTPLGIAVTGITHNRDAILVLEHSYIINKLSKEQLRRSIDSQKEGYQLAIDNLNRAVNLITNFKKVAVDQSSQEQREINLTQYISDIFGAYQPILKSNNISLVIDGDNDIDISTFPGPLYQVFNNLINNSISHAFCNTQDNQIMVDIARQGTSIIIRYRDNGIGMPAAILSKIYEPFMTTKRNQGGSGLGMHIVYNLVTQVFKGSIDASSTEHVGSEFVITFLINSTLDK